MKKPNENKDVEVLKEFANGAIRIEREFHEKLDREVEYVTIHGTDGHVIRVRRRDENHDRFADQKEGEKIPVFGESDKQFNSLTFGKAEIDFLQAALMRQAIGHHSLFLGPPGFGKTRMIEFMAYLLNVPYFRVQCVQGMDVEPNFLWTWIPNGSFKPRLGPLPLSMLAGGILHVDELNSLKAQDRQVILQPTEHPHDPGNDEQLPKLNLNDYPGERIVIQANPGWFLVATGNYREGQAAGEIHNLDDREERRVRPHMLGALPDGTMARRMVGRYLKDHDDEEEDDEDDDETPNRPENKNFYPEGVLKIPRKIVNAVSRYFEKFYKVVERDVLNDLRQDPRVFLREIAARAFDHFIRFQIQKAHKEGVNPAELRVEEILESAAFALEFYYLNAFREETRMKLPNIPDLRVSLHGKWLEDQKDTNGRVPVRAYLKWLIENLANMKLWIQPTTNLPLSFKERIQQTMGLETESEKEAKIQAEAKKRLLTQGIFEQMGQIMGGVQPDNRAPSEPVAVTPPAPPVPSTPEFVGQISPELSPQELLKRLGDSYEEMIKTLDAFGYQEAPPTRESVIHAIANLDPEKLAEIAKFGKPTVVMTPPGDFASRVHKINSHLKMPKQHPTLCDLVSTHALWAPVLTAWMVTIVDGVDAMPQPSYITDDLKVGPKMDKYEEEFAKKNLDVMSCHEGAMLMMQSLRLGKPLDDMESTNSVTYYSRKHLTKGSGVPYGCWHSMDHHVTFRGAGLGEKGSTRCRPSVRVL